MSDNKDTVKVKDEPYIEDIDKDELFTAEEGPSSTRPVEKDDTPKLSAEEIERYDRMIQEAYDNDLEYAKEVDENVKEKKTRKAGKMSKDELRLLARRAVEFVHKMDNAHAMDMEAFSRGEVVDNRLKMIKEVERVMLNKDLAVLCLCSGIIPVFAKWIRPGVHGELPFSRIRSGIYKILLDLPIKKAQIKEGRIGELVVKLWRNPKENEENKFILHQVIEKWLRMVTGMSADFDDETNEGLEDAAKEKAAYLASINRNRGDRFTRDQDDRSVFALMPHGQLNAYVIDAPSLNVKEMDKINPNSVEQKLRKLENSRKRKTR